MAEPLHEISVFKSWLAEFSLFDHPHPDPEDAAFQKDLIFMSDVIPILAELNSRKSFDLFRKHPWLGDFDTNIADFNLSLKVFFENMSDMPSILSCYVLSTRCILIRDIWKSEIYKGEDPQSKDSTRVFLRLLESPPSDAWSWHKDKSYALEVRRSVKCFENALEKVDEDIRWKSLKTRILKFNELVGCSASEDPFMNISALQAKFLKSTSERRELALQARIDDLEKRNRDIEQEARKQKKILTNLSLRHTLERLPPPGGKSEKETWAGFWQEAVKQANAGEAHPLTDLVRRYVQPEVKNHTVESVNRAGGAALYSTLSTDIHQYMNKDAFEFEPDQWHALEADILKALKPQKENVYPDGTVNWGQERSRYVMPKEDKEKKDAEKEGASQSKSKGSEKGAVENKNKEANKKKNKQRAEIGDRKEGEDGDSEEKKGNVEEEGNGSGGTTMAIINGTSGET
ncbi:MAG: hypothetical protein Q9195_004011 [Heterodermia aff. obscurata]